MPLPAALLAFLASPAGQAALATGIPLAAQGLQSAGGSIRRGIFGRNEGEQRQYRMGQLQDRLLDQAEEPYDFEHDFAPIEARARTQFREETLPEIGNYYAGLGNMQSSAYQNALSGAGASLEERLAALRGQGRLQARGLEQGRQNALFNYLSGQQGLAQQQHQFRQNRGLQQSQQGANAFQGIANQQNLRNPLEGLQRGYGGATGQPWNVTQQRTQGILPDLIRAAGQAAGAGLAAI
jgi:hypothetical protein